MNEDKQTAIVTGAGSGIGRAIAVRFLRGGWNVLAVEQSSETLESLLKQESAGSALAGIQCDVTDPAAGTTIFDACQASFGPPNCLVNNAGKGNAKEASQTSDADFEFFIDLNLGSVFRLSRAAVDRLAPQGSVVNIASVFGMTGFRGSAPYSAAKAGVIGLTRQMAADYGRRGIRFNAVAPGITVTAGTADRIQTNEWLLKAMVGTAPLGRLGQPEDIAEAVFFLASPAASYISSVVLPVDGGWTGTHYYPDL
ncbi:SDR family NAD(P)-dependent oxidoreductase [Microvirga antarctica]|uniref:SDR family NAD(P)-dependent oxidoreductase n=1 Tax=Microvirga antarctica TaxID=2819233 RepID=UPI001B3095D3|nr:SDR family oxidoreductase [Microvirga antarctica]